MAICGVVKAEIMWGARSIDEYQNILSELDGLDVLGDEDTVSLENDEYLIYKLEKNHHLTTSTPANEFTEKFYQAEIKRIEDALD